MIDFALELKDRFDVLYPNWNSDVALAAANKAQVKLGVSSVGYGTTSPHSAKRFLHQVKPGQFHVEPTVITVVINVVPKLVTCVRYQYSLDTSMSAGC